MELATNNTPDSQDLQALFDSIADSANVGTEPQPAVAAAPKLASHDPDKCAADKVISRIGQMTRALHDNLRELGYDKLLEKAATVIPDARDRLNYVATLTQQAAERVLNATDVAKPLQEQLGQGAIELTAQWDRLFAKELSVEEFKTLVDQTRGYLAAVPKKTRATNEQLMEIMMAQDFQDLTGQVIKKITELAQNMERELLQLLLENAPADIRTDVLPGLMNGPVINAQGRNDVVTSQSQVDELLESLGF